MRSFRRNKNENGGLRSSIREKSFKLEASNHHHKATITASNDSSISNITKLLRRSFPRPYGRSSIRGSSRLNNNSNHSSLTNYNGNDSSTISFQSSMYDSSFQSVDVTASFRSILDDEQYASLREDVVANQQHVVAATENLSTLPDSESSNTHRQEQHPQRQREEEQEQEQVKQSESTKTQQIEIQRTALINRSVFPRPYARVSSMHSLRSDTTDLMINSSHSLSGMSETRSTYSLDELNTDSTHSLYDLNEEDTEEVDDDPLQTELLNLDDQLKCRTTEPSSLQNRGFPLTSTHGSSFNSSEPSSSDTTSDYCDIDEYYKDHKEQATEFDEQMSKRMMMKLIATDTTEESVPESTARSDTSHNDDSFGRWNSFHKD